MHGLVLEPYIRFCQIVGSQIVQVDSLPYVIGNPREIILGHAPAARIRNIRFHSPVIL